MTERRKPDYCKKCGKDRPKRIGKTEAPCSHGGYCEWIPWVCLACGRSEHHPQCPMKNPARTSTGELASYMPLAERAREQRITIDAALVETLLEIPGVTEGVLRKAIYRFRTKLGLCTKGNGSCNEPALPGKPLCERHNELQEAANGRFQRKQTKA